MWACTTPTQGQQHWGHIHHNKWLGCGCKDCCQRQPITLQPDRHHPLTKASTVVTPLSRSLCVIACVVCVMAGLADITACTKVHLLNSQRTPHISKHHRPTSQPTNHRRAPQPQDPIPHTHNSSCCFVGPHGLHSSQQTDTLALPSRACRKQAVWSGSYIPPSRSQISHKHLGLLVPA